MREQGFDRVLVTHPAYVSCSLMDRPSSGDVLSPISSSTSTMTASGSSEAISSSGFDETRLDPRPDFASFSSSATFKERLEVWCDKDGWETLGEMLSQEKDLWSAGDFSPEKEKLLSLQNCN